MKLLERLKRPSLLESAFIRDRNVAVPAPFPQLDFSIERLGEIMRPKVGEPHETWGVLNPGGVRGPDGTMHLFPRLIAEGNFSRISHARVIFHEDKPVSVERLGMALEPHEPYELSAGGGGVEDPRVVYVPLIKRYVMTYTAFIPYEPKIAVAVSEDLVTWRRLGVLQYAKLPGSGPLELTGNKDAAFFSEVVLDPQGVPSLAVLHRPTGRVRLRLGGNELIMPPGGKKKRESIWISYVALDDVLADIANLTLVRRHERLMAPQQPWEASKIGTGAAPVRTAGGWLLPYHGACSVNGRPRYSMGVAVLDLNRPSRVLYRTPSPVLEPESDYERDGLISNVVFPSATDVRSDGTIDIYYGAADHVIAAARLTIPSELLTGL